MKIPLLTTFCCCFDIKTSIKVIGWILLIIGPFQLAAYIEVLKSLYDVEHQLHLYEDSQQIAATLPDSKALVRIRILFTILKFLFTIVLLMGTYQSKAKLIHVWLVGELTVYMVEQCVDLVQISMMSNPWIMILLYVSSFFHLYFLLVVYSFYRELKKRPTDNC